MRKAELQQAHHLPSLWPATQVAELNRGKQVENTTWHHREPCRLGNPVDILHYSSVFMFSIPFSPPQTRSSQAPREKLTLAAVPEYSELYKPIMVVPPPLPGFRDGHVTQFWTTRREGKSVGLPWKTCWLLSETGVCPLPLDVLCV